MLTAQQVSIDVPIDTLITRLPFILRNNDAMARQMIDALAQRSIQLKHRHGIIQSVFFKSWLS